jgi:addiction module RelB/DinJ family antitoxin
MAQALTNIQFRISTADKKKFAKILEDVGLDMPTAFRMFVKRVVASGGIPFKPQKLTENGMTLAEEQEILDIIKQAHEHPETVSGPFSDIDSLLKSLNS